MALEHRLLSERRGITAECSPKRPLRIFPLLIAFLLILPVVLSAGQYSVIQVVDGDTIVVNYQGKPEKVRLLHVNTPEAERYARKHKMNIWGGPELTERYLRLKSKWGQYG